MRIHGCLAFLLHWSCSWYFFMVTWTNFQITDACSACFEQRTVFTQQVLAKALNQMVFIYVLCYLGWVPCLIFIFLVIFSFPWYDSGWSDPSSSTFHENSYSGDWCFSDPGITSLTFWFWIMSSSLQKLVWKFQLVPDLIKNHIFNVVFICLWIICDKLLAEPLLRVN